MFLLVVMVDPARLFQKLLGSRHNFRVLLAGLKHRSIMRTWLSPVSKAIGEATFRKNLSKREPLSQGLARS